MAAAAEPPKIQLAGTCGEGEEGKGAGNQIQARDTASEHKIRRHQTNHSALTPQNCEPTETVPGAREDGRLCNTVSNCTEWCAPCAEQSTAADQRWCACTGQKTATGSGSGGTCRMARIDCSGESSICATVILREIWLRHMRVAQGGSFCQAQMRTGFVIWRRDSLHPPCPLWVVKTRKRLWAECTVIQRPIFEWHSICHVQSTPADRVSTGPARRDPR